MWRRCRDISVIGIVKSFAGLIAPRCLISLPIAQYNLLANFALGNESNDNITTTDGAD